MGSRRPRKDRWGRSNSCTHAHPPPSPKRTPRLTPEIPDVQIKDKNKVAGPLRCILISGRVFGPFMLLTNEQHIGPLSLAVCIKRSWASFLLPRLSTCSIGRLPQECGCGTQPTRSLPYLAEVDALRVPPPAGSLRPSPHRSG